MTRLMVQFLFLTNNQQVTNNDNCLLLHTGCPKKMPQQPTATVIYWGIFIGTPCRIADECGLHNLEDDIKVKANPMLTLPCMGPGITDSVILSVQEYSVE